MTREEPEINVAAAVDRLRRVGAARLGAELATNWIESAATDLELEWLNELGAERADWTTLIDGTDTLAPFCIDASVDLPLDVSPALLDAFEAAFVATARSGAHTVLQALAEAET